MRAGVLEAPPHGGKQAEFLVHDHVPWPLVVGIGTHSQAMADQVTAQVAASPARHRPTIKAKPDWYYA